LNYVKLFYGAMSLFVKKHYRGGSARFYYGLMQAAIWFKALLSGLGHAFLKILPSAPRAQQVRSMVVCDNQHFEYVKALLFHQQAEAHLVGRVAAGENPETGLLGKPGDLAEFVTKHQANEVVFCSHGLAIKQMIGFMQQLGPGIQYRFHLEGSLGIVGTHGVIPPATLIHPAVEM
jgi:hypothetical protein